MEKRKFKILKAFSVPEPPPPPPHTLTIHNKRKGKVEIQIILAVFAIWYSRVSKKFTLNLVLLSGMGLF